MADRRTLIVVSNRGPVTYQRDGDDRVARRGGGGLVTALRSLVEHHDVTWIASAMSEEDRAVAAESGERAVEERSRDGSVFRVPPVVSCRASAAIWAGGTGAGALGAAPAAFTDTPYPGRVIVSDAPAHPRGWVSNVESSCRWQTVTVSVPKWLMAWVPPLASCLTVATPPRTPIAASGVLMVAPWVWVTLPPTMRITPLVRVTVIRPAPALGL